MAIAIGRILLPTDFSGYSATATQYACELATKFDAELHLLHTLEVHLASTPGFGLGLALPQYTHESKAAAEKIPGRCSGPAVVGGPQDRPCGRGGVAEGGNCPLRPHA